MIEDDIFTQVTGIPVTFWRMLDNDGRKLKAGENDDTSGKILQWLSV